MSMKCCPDRRNGSVHKVCSTPAVDMNIDEARSNPASRCIDNRRVWRESIQGWANILNQPSICDQDARIENAIRENDSSIHENDRSTGVGSQESPLLELECRMRLRRNAQSSSWPAPSNYPIIANSSWECRAYGTRLQFDLPCCDRRNHRHAEGRRYGSSFPMPSGPR